MGRSKKVAQIEQIEQIEAQVEEIEIDAVEAAAEAEIEEQIALPRSVVKREFKLKYRDRARANGLKGKASKRSAWDWLAVTLAGEVLDDREKLIVDRFLAILDANGVDHSRWQNRSPGWEGRLRMTGRLALQRVVAEAGVLLVPDWEGGEPEHLVPPEAWVAKFLS
jgi:hypothetical protein